MKQLEMDFGMLTVEQQERVNRFVKSQAEHAVKNEQLVARDMEILVDAGFRPGIDFVNTFTSELVTEDYEFGYYENAFTAEVTYQKYTGGLFIVAKDVKLDENDQAVRSERHIYFTIQRDYKSNKIECSSLVGSYRAVKPETLFTKLMEYNQRQEDNAVRKLEQRIATRNGIAELKAKYPQATKIEECDQWVNRGYVKRVSVWFADGSRFDFRPTWNDGYTLDNVVDGQQLTMTELAEVIANRNNK